MMLMRLSYALLLGFTCLATLGAAEIEGTVVVKHRLTRKKVTLTSGEYERGVAVQLGSDPAERDFLAYERTHVVVYLEGDLPSTGTVAKMEQKDRRFVPDLLVIPRGSTVSFPNLDPIFHNVFSLSKPKNFDLGNYRQGQTRLVTFSKPGIVLVNCRLHSNMAAAIVITPNQCSSKPDADGRFLLRNVPPGKHTVVAWHKSAGFFRQTITASEAHPATVDFLVPLDENGVATTQAFLPR